VDPVSPLTAPLDDSVDANGMHGDVRIQEIEDSEDDAPASLNKTRPTADIEHFFKKVTASKRTPGDKKSRVVCDCCMYVTKLSPNI